MGNPGERELVRWLSDRYGRAGGRIDLGIGDDMAIVRPEGGSILITCDLLLDGVHFETARHSWRAIGRKAAACSLSDCAAMAVRPVAAVISVALPRGTDAGEFRALVEGVAEECGKFECTVVGGDTTSWNGALAIDVAMLAAPYPGITPIRRNGARVGDGVFVTGRLGGSLLGRHMTFMPRVREAKHLAEALGGELHAMMDVSDGLGIDLDRMIEASGVGATLEERSLLALASEAARESADSDGRGVLEHVLADGEDFELLLAASVASEKAGEMGLFRAGTIVEGGGMRLLRSDGTEVPLAPSGYQH